MDGLDANFEALEQCRMEISGQVGPVAAAADGLPSGITADAFGGLQGAGAFAEAVNALAGGIGGEIEQASKRLEQVAAALDATISTVRETEQNNAQSLAPA
jgi:methyl-accepting chemotaxis protein